MTAAPRSDFSEYLDSIRSHYKQWWELYTLTDVTRQRKVERQTDQASSFDFGLMVKTVKQSIQEQFEQQSEKSLERLPVLEGIHKYVFDPDVRQILLVGRPGSGKSTALARLLLEEATSPSDKIPVLVELRYWQGSIVELIRSAFKRHSLLIAETELEALLDENQLLLLFDGVNELPSDLARSQLTAFRRQYPQAAMIFTTRDLSLGGYLGIEKKLEMQPLTETQMSDFVRSYLGIEQGEQLLRQLKDRLRELGQTPLLLWILCEVVQQLPESKLPENLGGVFKVFTQSYKLSAVRKHEVAALKGDVRPLSDRRLWDNALQCLAFVMMQGKTDVDFRVVLDRAEAECELTNLFRQEPSPSKTARDCLDDLLNYHLLQLGNNPDQIEFRHQLIQEYYAAEALSAKLDHLSEDQLKGNYLNYLKWTEPIALMLALLEDDEKALAIVQWALDIDLMLGARLAGEARWEFQEQTVAKVDLLKLPAWLKVELLEKTRSESAIPGLQKIIQHSDSEVREKALLALLKNIDFEDRIPLLVQLIDDDQFSTDLECKAVEMLYSISSASSIPILCKFVSHPNSSVRSVIAEALGSTKSEDAIPSLIMLISDSNIDVRCTSIAVLSNFIPQVAIPILSKIAQNSDPEIRRNVVEGLERISSEAVIPVLIKLINDSNLWVRVSAARALLKHQPSIAYPVLIELSEKEDPWLQLCIADVLSNFDAQASLFMLTRLSENPNPSVRVGVAEVVGNVSSREIVFTLVRLANDEDWSVQRYAAKALSKMQLTNTISELTSLVDHPNPIVRFNLAVLLGRSDSKVAGYLLMELIDDNDSRVRRSVAEALGRMSLVESIPDLNKLLDDDDLLTQFAAADALINLNPETATHALIRLAKMEDSDIRHQALGTIDEINIVMNSSMVQLKAINRLGKLKSVDAISALTELVESKIDLTQLRSAIALSNLIPEASIPVLIKFGLSNSFFERDISIEALDSIKGHHASYILKAIGNQDLFKSNREIFEALIKVQRNCKFYNYEVYERSHQSTNLQQCSEGFETYNKALKIVIDVGREIERKPDTYRAMGEEALRNIFLTGMNAAYSGQATGETFNKKGKTDILLRVNNENVFIGECKFWGGKKKLKETLDQLLGYATWHDDQLALLFFNRNKNFSAVRDQIPEGIKGHPCFVREGKHPIIDFFYIVQHPDDCKRELKLAVLAFDIPL